MVTTKNPLVDVLRQAAGGNPVATANEDHPPPNAGDELQLLEAGTTLPLSEEGAGEYRPAEPAKHAPLLAANSSKVQAAVAAGPLAGWWFPLLCLLFFVSAAIAHAGYATVRQIQSATAVSLLRTYRSDTDTGQQPSDDSPFILIREPRALHDEHAR